MAGRVCEDCVDEVLNCAWHLPLEMLLLNAAFPTECSAAFLSFSTLASYGLTNIHVVALMIEKCGN